jgi:hypothetical protein
MKMEFKKLGEVNSGQQDYIGDQRTGGTGADLVQ